MKNDRLHIGLQNPSLCFWTEAGYRVSIRDNLKNYPHYKLYQAVIRKLGRMKFKVTEDPRIKADYPTLSPSHRYGINQGLEVDIQIYPTGFKLEFYQNINTGERPVGKGKYCFNKYDLMVYLMKKKLEYTLLQITRFIQSKQEVKLEYSDTPKLAEEAIIKHVQTYSFAPKNQVYAMADLEKHMSQYDHTCNAIDRDEKLIKCGQVKYFRCFYTGRLNRGVVYHNINNMWWVIVNKFYYRNLASFELFDPSAEDFKARRKARDRRSKVKD